MGAFLHVPLSLHVKAYFAIIIVRSQDYRLAWVRSFRNRGSKIIRIEQKRRCFVFLSKKGDYYNLQTKFKSFFLWDHFLKFFSFMILCTFANSECSKSIPFSVKVSLIPPVLSSQNSSVN